MISHKPPDLLGRGTIPKQMQKSFVTSIAHITGRISCQASPETEGIRNEDTMEDLPEMKPVSFKTLPVPNQF